MVIVCEPQLVRIRIGIKNCVCKLRLSLTRCHNILQTVIMNANLPCNPLTHGNNPIICGGTAVTSIAYGSPALMAITNLGYGNDKAFPDTEYFS
jgi:hypothetical protein